MKTKISALVVLLCARVSLALTNSNSIGQGFYLADMDILGEFDKGATIFDEIPPKCFSVVPNPATKQV